MRSRYGQVPAGGGPSRDPAMRGLWSDDGVLMGGGWWVVEVEDGPGGKGKESGRQGRREENKTRGLIAEK